MDELHLIRHKMDLWVLDDALSALDSILEAVSQKRFADATKPTRAAAVWQRLRMLVHDFMHDASVHKERKAILHSRLSSLLAQMETSRKATNPRLRLNHDQAITLLTECFREIGNLEAEFLALRARADDLLSDIRHRD